MEPLLALFWGLLVTGIWAQAIIVMFDRRYRRSQNLDDFLRYKY